MGRFHSHMATATRVINVYGAGKPLSLQLKTFFAADKKYGSGDRRSISALCYYYFRTGKAFSNKPVEEKICMGLFLCENAPNPLLQEFMPALNEKITLPLQEKMKIVNLEMAGLFPFIDQLGGEVDPVLFVESFLVQPDLFLRVRPGKMATVKHKLDAAGIAYTTPGNDCLRLASGRSADQALVLNKEAVVQDLNSQRVFDYLDTAKEFTSEAAISVWDCCAASGGKSILLHDKLNGQVELTMSDIRENILAGLRKRFQQARIPIGHAFVADLASGLVQKAQNKFQVIICDAPCTGSGTWSRTPEQLFSFKKEMIETYAARQRAILANVVTQLAPGGLLFYITCSVFKKENEEIAGYLESEPGLRLLNMTYLNGYTKKADTMFVAVLQR